MKIYYKDIITGKRRFTRANPIRATRGGIVGAWGLHVKGKSFEMFIPEYILDAEGREILKSLKEEEQEKCQTLKPK